MLIYPGHIDALSLHIDIYLIILDISQMQDEKTAGSFVPILSFHWLSLIWCCVQSQIVVARSNKEGLGISPPLAAVDCLQIQSSVGIAPCPRHSEASLESTLIEPQLEITRYSVIFLLSSGGFCGT